jgi:hypothetical protein
LYVLSEEKLEFSKTLLIGGNLALIAWIFLAFFGVWFYNQIYGWLFLIFTAAIIFMILRRLGCSSCYNCKKCTSGFGRIAGAFFGRGNLKKGSIGNRIGLIVFIYFLLAPVSMAPLSISISQSFSLLKVLTLAGITTISVFSLSTWTKKATVVHAVETKKPLVK